MASIVRATPVTTAVGSRPERRWRTTLTVEAIELDVHLGCEAEERRVPQKVRLGLRVHFEAPPAACWTDSLGDTACYAELAATARDFCASREFRLVEHLAAALYDPLSARLPRGARLDLEVDKVAPPVPELRGGVRFRIVSE
ncbi:MAG: dihydroneopterin aldolase [Deltaproteobacteria bacterium]|nr:dihydroneopterin aldolase [Deltaproteobacteria bacterium]